MSTQTTIDFMSAVRNFQNTMNNEFKTAKDRFEALNDALYHVVYSAQQFPEVEVQNTALKLTAALYPVREDARRAWEAEEQEKRSKTPWFGEVMARLVQCQDEDALEVSRLISERDEIFYCPGMIAGCTQSRTRLICLRRATLHNYSHCRWEALFIGFEGSKTFWGEITNKLPIFNFEDEISKDNPPQVKVCLGLRWTDRIFSEDWNDWTAARPEPPMMASMLDPKLGMYLLQEEQDIKKAFDSCLFHYSMDPGDFAPGDYYRLYELIARSYGNSADDRFETAKAFMEAEGKPRALEAKARREALRTESPEEKAAREAAEAAALAEDKPKRVRKPRAPKAESVEAVEA